MEGSAPLGAVTIAVLVLNLPFGFWRAGLRRFSLPWFVAVHAPVPLVIGLRALVGVGWTLGTFTLLAGAFLAGQILGARSRRWRIHR
jgi:hypothetical protein